MSRPDAAQLAHTASRAIWDHYNDDEIGPREFDREARAATSAVLRGLAGRLGPNDRPDHGCYWSPAALRELADQIEQENHIQQAAAVIHDALCSECSDEPGTGLTIRGRDAEQAARALADAGLLRTRPATTEED